MKFSKSLGKVPPAIFRPPTNNFGETRGGQVRAEKARVGDPHADARESLEPSPGPFADAASDTALTRWATPTAGGTPTWT